MSIDTTMTTSASQATPQPAGATGSNALGKDEFLKILTAQLANQDPTAPMDNTAFVAQLAQFSTLEQMQNSNDTLTQMLALQKSSQQSVDQSSMVSMVGKYAVTSGNTTEITSDGVGSVNATLASDAADVVMEVDDANGNALRHQSFGAFAAGVQSLTWDGLSDGQAVQPVGTYQVKVSAVDKNGQPVTVSQQSTRQITGVSFDSGTAQLMLGNTPVSLSDVISIQQSNSSQPNSQ